MKLYTVAVYILKMSLKGDKAGPKNIKGDNSREIIVCERQGYPL